MIITYEKLTALRKNNKGKKIGIILGAFDLFHYGHLNFIKVAKAQCDILVVGVRDDSSTKITKGETIIDENQRMSIIDAIKYVDYTVLRSINDKSKNYVPKKPCDKITFELNAELFKKLKPDVFILPNKNYSVTADFIEHAKNSGIKIIYTNYTDDISTTIIKDRIKQAKD